MLKQSKFKTITNTVALCKHTGIKIGMSVHFHNISSLRLEPEHPIFHADASTLQDLVNGAERLGLTTTERYLACVAYLVKAGLVDTSKCGLALDSEEFNRSAAIYMLPKLFPLLRKFANDKALADEELPVLAISADNCESGAALNRYLKLLTKRLESMVTTVGAFDFDDDYQLLVEELHAINNGRNNRLPTRSMRKKFVLYCKSYTTNKQQDAIAKYLLTNDTDKLDSKSCHQIIDWLIEEVGTASDFYTDLKAAIIRYLEHIIAVNEDVSGEEAFKLIVESELKQLKPKATSKARTNGKSALEKLRNKMSNVTMDFTAKK